MESFGRACEQVGRHEKPHGRRKARNKDSDDTDTDKQDTGGDSKQSFDAGVHRRGGLFWISATGCHARTLSSLTCECTSRRLDDETNGLFAGSDHVAGSEAVRRSLGRLGVESHLMGTPAFPRRAVVSLSGLVAVAYGTQLYALSVMVTGKAAGGDFSISLLSAGFGGAAIVAGLSAPLVGRIADRHSVRGLIGFGALLSGSAFGLLAVATAGWHVILVFWFLLGPATAMTGYEPAYVAIGQWVSALDRNRAIALVSVVGGLAGPIFIPLTGWMVITIGWRAASGVLGMTMVVAGGLGAFFFLPKGGPRTETVSVASTVPWRRFFEDRRLFAFSAAVLVSFGVLSTVFLHRVALFEEAGFDVRYVAFLAGMSSLFTFPGRWLAPRMAEKVSAISIFVWACAGLAGVMLFAVAAKPAWVMWAFFVLFGLFFGALLPMRAVIMNEWYAGEDFGLLMGKQWSLAALAGGVMPWVGGVLRDALGDYTVSMLIVVVGMAAAAVLGIVAGRASDDSIERWAPARLG